MGNSKTSSLLSLIGVLLICPHVLTKSISPTLQTADNSTLTPGEGEERPPVVERRVMSCSSTFDNFCMNNGKCMLLVDLGEHHCKCEEGFHGPRCDSPEFVFQPLDKEQILIIIFCVILLMIGLTGALYFCCKCYKKNKFPRQQKQTDYKRVQKI